MGYSYSIEQTNKGLIVRIFYDDSEIIFQPFDPRTGLPFKSEEDAKNWIYDVLSFIMTPEEYEEFMAKETGTTTESTTTENTANSTTTESTAESTTENTTTESTTTESTAESTTTESTTESTTAENTTDNTTIDSTNN